MPCRRGEAGLPALDGRVRFRRRFGYPGRIDVHERVWLTFEGVADDAAIRLNDRVLERNAEAGATLEFDVTSLLQARNELVVDVEGTAERSGLWGEVALEVRCTAFLRGLRRCAILAADKAELRVTGQVVGTADRPLELYVVLDRFVVAYQVVSATPAGQPFEVLVPDVAAEIWRGPGGALRSPVVKVDLVNGATVWYSSEAEWTFVPASVPGA
jgi:hypothetical protein